MIGANEIKKGMVIKFKDELYKVEDFSHTMPGKGVAYIQAKLRNIKTGGGIENRFRSNDKIDPAFIESQEMEFLYNTGDEYYFMNKETYDQIPILKDVIGEPVVYLQPNMDVKIEKCDGEIIGIQIPNTVVLAVKHTDPHLKGATATNQYKPALLENGLTVSVPPFIQIGEKLKIDTRSGEYIERAK